MSPEYPVLSDGPDPAWTDPMQPVFGIPEKRYLASAYPHFTVSVLPYDPRTKEGLLMWRGNNVRSAKNCLAIPSGLLEHGEAFHEAIFRELAEELAIPGENLSGLQFHSIYRNLPGDGFDWVIGIWSVKVLNLAGVAKNMEPHKHDWIQCLRLASIVELTELKHLWGGGLADALKSVALALNNA